MHSVAIHLKGLVPWIRHYPVMGTGWYSAVVTPRLSARWNYPHVFLLENQSKSVSVGNTLKLVFRQWLGIFISYKLAHTGEVTTLIIHGVTRVNQTKI